jgi:BatD DUF11 like domain
MNRPRRLVIAAALLALSAIGHAAVTTSLGRDQIALGDSVQLTLQRDSAGGGEPDLSPLEKDFDILGRSASTSLQMINGKSSAQRQLILTLVPKHDGPIEVPALQWGGEQSSPLNLSVSANGNSGGGNTGAPPSTAHALLSSRVDTPNPYVQAGVMLTVKVDTDDAINQPSLEFPGSNDVVVQRFGQDMQGEETRNGRRYHVTERRYLLFPQRSGELRLDGPVLDAQVAEDDLNGSGGVDPLFGRIFGSMRLPGTLQPLRLRGDAVSLKVRPRPTGQQASDWLPAKAVTLDDEAPTKVGVHAGDPITLRLRLGAVGLAAAQLPDLSTRLQLPAGLRAYPDQPRLVDGEKDGSILGRREQDVALIADQPGRYTLPALHLSWWDTAKDQPREAVLPARTFEVLPAVNGSAAPAPPIAAPAPAAPVASSPALEARPTADPLWRWISLGLGLLWIATLLGWWFSRRQAGVAAPARVAAPQAGLTEPAARRAFEAACREDAPQRARAAALAWAAVVWPKRPPNGLHALGRKIADAEVTRLLRELDQACIDQTSWHGAALADRLPSLQPDAPEPAATSRLPGLYGSDAA